MQKGWLWLCGVVVFVGLLGKAEAGGVLYVLDRPTLIAMLQKRTANVPESQKPMVAMMMKVLEKMRMELTLFEGGKANIYTESTNPFTQKTKKKTEETTWKKEKGQLVIEAPKSSKSKKNLFCKPSSDEKKLTCYDEKGKEQLFFDKSTAAPTKAAPAPSVPATPPAAPPVAPEKK